MTVDFAQAVSVNPAAQDVASLRQVFATLHAQSCPTVYNFHMHTVCSDGRLQPETLMQQAIAIGLAGLAITDHHCVDGFRRAQHWMEAHPYRALFDLWTGLEVTSTLLDTEVHILGYAFDPDHAALDPYLQGRAPQGNLAQADRVIAAIQAAGGLAVLAHPVRYRKSPEELIPAAAEAGIDGVEAFYAYDNPQPWRTSPDQTQRVLALQQAHDLLHSCGTDTHGENLLQRI